VSDSGWRRDLFIVLPLRSCGRPGLHRARRRAGPGGGFPRRATRQRARRSGDNGPNRWAHLPDSIAVTCLAGAAFCSLYRPGPRREAVPVTTGIDLTMWGSA
jgi:hypothetical protein